MTVNLPTYNISMMKACIFIAKLQRYGDTLQCVLQCSAFFWEEYTNLTSKDNNRVNTLQLLWSMHMS